MRRHGGNAERKLTTNNIMEERRWSDGGLYWH